MRKFAAALVIGMMTYVPAQAQELDMQTLVDRIERIDRDIKALNIRVYRDGATAEGASAATNASGSSEVSGPLGARLSIRMTELEGQIRELTGQLEQTAFRISQLNARMDKFVADMEYRVTTLEGGNPAARPNTGALSGLQPQTSAPGNPSTLAPPPGAVATPNLPPASPPGVLGTLTEKDLSAVPTQPTQQPITTTETTSNTQVAVASSPAEAYENARQLLLRGNYNEAENGFKTFLSDNGDHELVGNARYWLGETYYVQGDFAQAASTFLEGYQKTPRGAKAPDSLLKLGMSLVRMEKTVEACSAFSRLRSSFPKMPANISKTLERERIQAECS